MKMYLDRAAEWCALRLVGFMVNMSLIGIGALLGSYFPTSFWWFFGVVVFLVSCLVIVGGMVLIAQGADMPSDIDMD